MKNTIWLLVGIVLIALDLITKYFATTYLAQPNEIWPGIFQLSLSHNSGVAFSIPIPNVAMLAITPALLAIAAWFFAKNCRIKNHLAKSSLALILAGGIGNFINRIYAGSVVDFLDFSFWPSFNLADSYIVIGVLLAIAFHGKIINKNS